MFLSDPDIIDAIARQDIVLDPPAADEDIQSVGIRMRLGRDLLIPIPGQRIDPCHPIGVEYHLHDLEEHGPYVLEPGGFVLGATRSSIKTDPKILVFLDTRSTIARYGIQSHLASHTINGTWDHPLHAVLEIANLGPLEIVLSHRMPIGMVSFAEMSRPPSKERRGIRFGIQDGPRFPGPERSPTPRLSWAAGCGFRLRRWLADRIAPRP